MEWVVVDYAGVISHQPPEDAGVSLARTLGVTVERFWPVYWQGREAYDRGMVDAAGYWGEVCGRLGRAANQSLLESLVELDVGAWTHINQDTLRVLEDVARDVPLALLSNAPVEIARLIDQQSWAGLFRHRFFSADLRQVKPEPGIFREVCGRLGTRPSEMVFVDDRAENVAAAEGVGIRSILFTDALRLRSDLADALPGS